MQLVFEQIGTGGDRNFGYVLGDRQARQAVLIDPSYAPEVLVQRAQDQDLRVSHIINTHGHPDHINGNEQAVALTHAPVAAHPDVPTRVDVRLSGGDSLTVGALELRFFHTPGHAADHLVIFEPSYRLLITGDLLFVGKVGGTRSDEDARTEWDSLQRVLDAVPDDTTVWPGHDYGIRPSSTIAIEKKTNPFLLCDDVDAFIHLKAEWAAVKQRYGLK
ncbi:MAG TPA: MBL fold metallo-hydrolase [Vicinamibacterales bacterium]|nr:MBL fold metallo-hydrolase [Vicinamibacterales bacterium]